MQYYEFKGYLKGKNTTLLTLIMIFVIILDVTNIIIEKIYYKYTFLVKFVIDYCLIIIPYIIYIISKTNVNKRIRYDYLCSLIMSIMAIVFSIAYDHIFKNSNYINNSYFLILINIYIHYIH